MRGPVLQEPAQRLAARQRVGVVTLPPEETAKAVSQPGVVVDDKYGSGHAANPFIPIQFYTNCWSPAHTTLTGRR